MVVLYLTTGFLSSLSFPLPGAGVEGGAAETFSLE